MSPWHIYLLDLFSWRAWGWPTMSKHVALTYIPFGSVFLEGLRMTYYVETCCPDIYTFWICFLGGSEDDLLCRNMSPWHIYLLDLFSWMAWGWPTRSKHVALTYIPSGSVFLEGLRMTYYVETCRTDIYTIVYKINFVLFTDVLCLSLSFTLSGVEPCVTETLPLQKASVQDQGTPVRTSPTDVICLNGSL